MVRDNYSSNEKRNGSSFAADGLVRVQEYHPTSHSSSSSPSLLLPPRVPIPRLFSRSIDTWSQQQQQLQPPPPLQRQQQQQQQQQLSTLPQQVHCTANHQPTVSFVTTRSGDSNPSDCRSRTIIESERSATPTSGSSSSSSSGPLIIHPSTLSYDDATQSRDPSDSVGTNEANEQQQQRSFKYPPSPPPQKLYPSSRILSTSTGSTMVRQQLQSPLEKHENDDEKKTMDVIDHDERVAYRPRGSIRDVTHSWDRDVPNFPIHEIQRIQQKTNRLRTNRSRDTPPNDSTTSTDMEVVTVDSKNTSPTTGQSVRSASHRTKPVAPPPHPSSSSKYQQHWTNLNHWNHNSNTSRGSKDSLPDILGPAPSQSRRRVSAAAATTSATPLESTMEDSQNSNGSISGFLPFLSAAAMQAEQRLRQDFHKPREASEVDHKKSASNNNVNTSTETDYSHASQNDSTEPNLILHDLCGEAVSTDDIAWRNALSVLATQPELASVVDPTQIWTPLHICCLGMTPPPTYIVRALLYVYPKATYIPDDGGRLTLHLVAASSADLDILQMIVQENPAALYHRDDHGLTPLHLYIRNRSVELTLQRIKILLGYTLTDQNNHDSPSKRHVRQRRGDHLRMSVQSVDQWMLQQKCRPITNLNHNSMIHEQFFDTYPTDVQVSLRQLSQWKHSNNHASMEEIESVEIQLSHTDNKDDHQNDDDDDDHCNFNTTKPAAIPLPNATQYPIHMIVQRMIIEEAFVPRDLAATSGPTVTMNEESNKRNPQQKEMQNENIRNPTSESIDEDDDEEVNVSYEQFRPNQTSSILRMFAASFPEGLILRDKNGYTPLLQVMQIRDSFPSVEVVEILIGKRNASGFEALPSWAHNLPTHTMIMQHGSSSMSSDQRRYMNPAMMAALETGQLPLHIAAEEAPTDVALVQTIYECYPAAILVQDGRGRTPLHLSFHNYRRIAPDPKVIETLYSDSVANIVDDYGKIPFDLLVEHAQLLSWHKPQTSGDMRTSSVYRKLFSASISGAGHPTSTNQVQSYLPRLRTLPPWLRVEACSTTFVQDLIIEDLVSPWKCASILLDGVLLITLITVFRLQMKEYIDQLDDDNLIATWYTYTVYATAVGRFMAKILFAYITTTIGEFRPLCLFNLWYWIDLWAMLMSIVTSIFLYGNTSDERLLVLGTATTILLWLSFVGYLSSWWYSMAIFTGGFLQVRLMIGRCLDFSFTFPQLTAFALDH